MAFFDTLTVLNELKAKLEALKWTPAADGSVPQTAFEKVELFDIEEFGTALEELLVFKGRVCFVVLEGEQFQNERSGQKLFSTQTRSVILMISDRNFGKRQKALVGTDSSPGVIALKDLVLKGDGTEGSSLVGRLESGVLCQPLQGSFVQLTGENREQAAGRLIWTLDVQLVGGKNEAALGKAPVW